MSVCIYELLIPSNHYRDLHETAHPHNGFSHIGWCGRGFFFMGKVW